MSGLIGSLLANSKTLGAQSQALETTGKNLANVGNPNYARQRVALGDSGTIRTGLGLQSTGVVVIDVTSARNNVLDSQIMREIMKKSSLDSQHQVAGWLESALGEVVDTKGTPNQTGISHALSNLFNSFSALAASPTDSAQRQAVIQAAQSLIDQFHSLDARLSQVDSDIALQIDTNTTKVNDLLAQIGDLNNQIAKLEIGNMGQGGALDLRDARAAKLEELASYMDFSTQNTSNGMIQVIAKNSTGGNVVLVDGPIVNGSVAYTGTGYTGGLPATALTVSSGSLNGLQAVRSTTLTDLRANLNRLSSQIVTATNTAYGANFFRADTLNPTLYKSAATIQLDPALTAANIQTGPSGQPGDNATIKAMADLATRTFSTPTDTIDGTFSGYYNGLVTTVGQKVSSTKNQMDSSDLVVSALANQRESASGVSQDEEMANLLVFQRAFQGTARVITTMDNMLDTIINRMG